MKKRFFQLASTRVALCAFGWACAPLICVASAQDASPASASQSAPAIREIAFQTLSSGTKSGCVRPAKMVIGEEKEWRRVWRVHDATAAVPPVDFARFRVVALLSGKGGAPQKLVQVASTRIAPTREEITVFFHQGAAAKKQDAPFQFALIPKIGSQTRFVDQNGKVCAVCYIS